jgi:hypothetical protein
LDLKAGENNEDDNLGQMSHEINDLFVTRQNTFNQKLVDAYVQKEYEANEYRSKLQNLIEENKDFIALQQQN